MTFIHRMTLYGLLGILGISLVIPGLIELFRPADSRTWLIVESPDAGNQLRAFNGMMIGMGLIALWSLINLDDARILVLALGVVLVPVIVGRIYAIFADGVPNTVTWVYLGIEIVMAVVFLSWPPPR